MIKKLVIFSLFIFASSNILNSAIYLKDSTQSNDEASTHLKIMGKSDQINSNNQQIQTNENLITLNLSVVEIIDKNPKTQKFMKALKAAEMDFVLEGPGPFTMFVPNDEAFNEFGIDQFNNLLLPENKAKLRQIVLYAIVPGYFLENDLISESYPTAAGENLKIKATEDQVTVNGARVIGGNLEGKNGVVHIVDQVLTP